MWANTTLHKEGDDKEINDKVINDHNDVHTYTHSWTAADCEFFNISYFNVSDWRGSICEAAPSLPSLLQQVADWKMSLSDFTLSMYFTQYYYIIIIVFVYIKLRQTHRGQYRFQSFCSGDYIAATRRPGHLKSASDLSSFPLDKSHYSSLDDTSTDLDTLILTEDSDNEEEGREHCGQENRLR